MDKRIINYTTTEQQIEILKNQNLEIPDISFAKEFLNLYGYSNLIKSYRDPYMVMENGKKLYRNGIKFEQICSLYILDKNLRSAVIRSMLDLEERVKSAAADVVAYSFGTDPAEYLRFNNYRDRVRSKFRFSLPGILRIMHNTLDTDKDPIAHYANNYGTVPPWILFKSLQFGTIVNFISLFKAKQKEMMVSRLYDLDNLSHYNTDNNALMIDTLFICSEYRNVAAHGGYIYNYHSRASARFIAEQNINVSGFSQLLFLLKLFDYQAPYEDLISCLNTELERHCSMYMDDLTFLSRILNMNINARKAVWITGNKKIYHSFEHCSGMQNAIKVPLDVVSASGFAPCKKCCK